MLNLVLIALQTFGDNIHNSNNIADCKIARMSKSKCSKKMSLFCKECGKHIESQNFFSLSILRLSKFDIKFDSAVNINFLLKWIQIQKNYKG